MAVRDERGVSQLCPHHISSKRRSSSLAMMCPPCINREDHASIVQPARGATYGGRAIDDENVWSARPHLGQHVPYRWRRGMRQKNRRRYVAASSEIATILSF